MWIFLSVAPNGTQALLMVLKELERGQKAQFEHIPNLAIADNKRGFTFTPRQNEEIDYNKGIHAMGSCRRVAHVDTDQNFYRLSLSLSIL